MNTPPVAAPLFSHAAIDLYDQEATKAELHLRAEELHERLKQEAGTESWAHVALVAAWRGRWFLAGGGGLKLV